MHLSTSSLLLLIFISGSIFIEPFVDASWWFKTTTPTPNNKVPSDVVSTSKKDQKLARSTLSNKGTKRTSSSTPSQKSWFTNMFWGSKLSKVDFLLELCKKQGLLTGNSCKLQNRDKQSSQDLYDQEAKPKDMDKLQIQVGEKPIATRKNLGGKWSRQRQLSLHHLKPFTPRNVTGRRPFEKQPTLPNSKPFTPMQEEKKREKQHVPTTPPLTKKEEYPEKSLIVPKLPLKEPQQVKVPQSLPVIPKNRIEEKPPTTTTNTITSSLQIGTKPPIKEQSPVVPESPPMKQQSVATTPSSHVIPRRPLKEQQHGTVPSPPQIATRLPLKEPSPVFPKLVPKDPPLVTNATKTTTQPPNGTPKLFSNVPPSTTTTFIPTKAITKPSHGDIKSTPVNQPLVHFKDIEDALNQLGSLNIDEGSQKAAIDFIIKGQYLDAQYSRISEALQKLVKHNKINLAANLLEHNQLGQKMTLVSLTPSPPTTKVNQLRDPNSWIMICKATKSTNRGTTLKTLCTNLDKETHK